MLIAFGELSGFYTVTVSNDLLVVIFGGYQDGISQDV